MKKNKITKQIKMFIWKDVLVDNTSGMVAIYAHDLEEALAVARKKFEPYVVEGFAELTYKVITKPDAFYVWGSPKLYVLEGAK